MLQIAYIRENKDRVVKRLAKKNLDAKSTIEEVIALDEKRRATQVELDTIKSESNRLSKDIGDLMKSGEKAKAEILKEKSVQLRERDKELSEVLKTPKESGASKAAPVEAQSR
jgi:seryl-tRNA synthetase